MQDPDDYLRKLDQIDKIQNMNIRDIGMNDLVDDNRFNQISGAQPAYNSQQPPYGAQAPPQYNGKRGGGRSNFAPSVAPSGSNFMPPPPPPQLSNANPKQSGLKPNQSIYSGPPVSIPGGQDPARSKPPLPQASDVTNYKKQREDDARRELEHKQRKKLEEKQKNEQIIDAMNQFKQGNEGIPLALFLGNLNNQTEEEDGPIGPDGKPAPKKAKEVPKDPDGLDNDALRKIEEFKQKYKEMQDKAAENERELAYSTIKVDEIVDKIKEVDNKKNDFKQQLYDETKENQKLRKKLRELEDEKIELEEQLETGMKPQKISKVKEVNLEKHKKMMEDKDKREREEMRKQIIHGVDYVGQKDYFKIFMAKKKGACSACLEKVNRFIEKISPLRSDVISIKAQYDKAVSGYFDFFRYLFISAVLTLFLFAGLLITHVLKYDYNYTEFCSGVVSTPCIFFYSHFDSNRAILYSGTLIGLIIFGIISTLYEWVQFDLQKKEQDLYEDQKKKFSKLFFDAWNWRMENKFEARQLRKIITNEIKLNLDEEKIREVIKKRNNSKRWKIYAIRAFTFTFNLGIVIGGCILIIYINIEQEAIKEYFSTNRILKYVSEFAPGLFLALINSVTPNITKVIVAIEQWDFKNQVTKNQVWRNYLAKILNLGVYLLIQLELASDQAIFTTKGTPIINFGNFKTKYNCREDLASENMIKLVITEFFIQLIRPWGIVIAALAYKRCLRGEKQWKPEFALSDEIVWILYFQAIAWLTTIVYPFTALLMPLFLYLIFKYNYFALKRLKGKQKLSSNANDTGYFIMIFLNITFLFVVCVIVAFMTLEMRHYTFTKVVTGTTLTYQCGPFADNSAAQTPIEKWINKYNFTDYTYQLLKFYPFLWLVGILLVTLFFFKRNHAKLLKTFVKEKDQEYLLQIDELQKSIVKLEKKIDFNKQAL